MVAALSKLKVDGGGENVETETAIFWKAPRELEGQPPSAIATEVYLLPARSFAEKDGTFTNSARGCSGSEGHRPAGTGQARSGDRRRLVLAVRGLYKRKAASCPTHPEPVWSYPNPYQPDLGEVLKEMNGKAAGDLHDEKDPTRSSGHAGQQVDGFGQRLRDGRLHDVRQLAALGWCFTEGGQQRATRATTDRLGRGCSHTGPSPGPPTGA